MTTHIDVLGKTMKVDGELVSLTDLWKGQGSDPSKKPVQWLRWDGASKLIAALGEKLKGENPHLLEVRKGRTGGTYAHWQIALAYAEFLSPDLHLAVNDVYRRFQQADVELVEHMVERMDPGDAKRVEARARARVSNKELTATIQEHGGEGRTYAEVNNLNNVAVTGKTARQIKESAGVPATAQTRDLLTEVQLSGLNYAEKLEVQAIKERRDIGHDRIVGTCREVASDVAAITRKYAGGASESK